MRSFLNLLCYTYACIMQKTFKCVSVLQTKDVRDDVSCVSVQLIHV